MGRSVGRHPYSVANAFFTPDEDALEFFAEDVIEPLQDDLQHFWPSVSPTDRWEGREGHVIAENRHAMFVLYEYCGLCCLSLVPRDDHSMGEQYGIALRWCSQIAPRFLDAFSELRPIARASNGEEFFERTQKAA